MVESEDIEEKALQICLNMLTILVPADSAIGVLKEDSRRRLREDKQNPVFRYLPGMQCAVIEFARNVCGMQDANSAEFDQATPFPVISLMEDQAEISARAAPCGWDLTLAR